MDQAVGCRAFLPRQHRTLNPRRSGVTFANRRIEPSGIHREGIRLDKPWWASAIQWSIWAVVMTLVMGWLARSRTRKRPSAPVGTMAYPASVLVIAVVCTIVFSGLGVITIVSTDGSLNPLVYTVFLAFAGLGIYLLLAYFMVHHIITDSGLEFRRFTGSEGAIRWPDVSEVSYSEILTCFKIKTVSGNVVRVSAMLLGLDGFAETVLANVPPHAMSSRVRAILEATASGTPPRIW